MPNTISQNLQRLQDAKDAIASKIIELGGTVNSGDGLEEFPDDMDSIQIGNGYFVKLEIQQQYEQYMKTNDLYLVYDNINGSFIYIIGTLSVAGSYTIYFNVPNEFPLSAIGSWISGRKYNSNGIGTFNPQIDVENRIITINNISGSNQYYIAIYNVSV